MNMSDDIVPPIISQRRGSSPTLERIVDSCIVVWLDKGRIILDDLTSKFCDQGTNDYSDPIFVDIDKCIDFITDIENENVFLVLFQVTVAEKLVAIIQNISQIDSIYIFSQNNNSIRNELWVKNCEKIRGIFDELSSMYDSLDQHIRERELDLTPISIISAANKIELDDLDQSFMYSQLLKEILLQINFHDKAKEEFVNYLRILYTDNQNQLNAIEEFEENYSLHSPIWWYTKEFFLYSMLNRALRTQDLETIIKMAFFIQDLHQQISKIHNDNYQTTTTSTKVIYLGQSMSNIDFEKITNNACGLLSFNSFILTSKNQQTSLLFAKRSANKPDLTGVLFQMTIDPSISSVPFAALDGIGYSTDGNEQILLSMHTVFRIDELYQIDDRLWQINLTLTSDDHDERLKKLNNHIRKDTRGRKGWLRLGKLILKMDELNKAEYIYQTILKTKSEDPSTIAYTHHYLGAIFQQKLDLTQALFHYKQSIDIKLEYLPSDQSGLSSTYNNIGMIFEQQGHFDKALEYFQHALNIEIESQQSDQLNIATNYHNIGRIFQNQGKYNEALDNYERSLKIRRDNLSSDHPDLAAIYAEIATVYQSKTDFSSALLYSRKSLSIAEKSLPPDHPLMGQYYHSMATIYENLHQYDEAIKYAEFAMDIIHETCGSDHPQVSMYEQRLNSLRQKHDSN